MKYVIDLSPREDAGFLRHLAALNAQRPPEDQLTAEGLLRAGVPLDSWADTYAPEILPAGKWLQRWTPEEKKAARALGAKDAQVQAWLDELDAHESVNLSHAAIQIGVPTVCAALEQMGVIAPGQAVARAAAIAAY